MKNVIKKILFSSYKEYIYKFIITILDRAILLAIPIFYSYAIEYVSKKDFKMAYTMIILFAAGTLLYRIFEYLNEKFHLKLYTTLYFKFLNIGLRKTHNNSIHSLSRINLGQYSNIMSDDIDVMSDFYSIMVYRFVQLLEIIFIYGYLIIINIYIGIASIISSLLVVTLLFFFGIKLQQENEKRKYRNDKRIGIIHELFLGIKEIKGFNIFSGIDKRTKNAVKDFLKQLTRYKVTKQVTSQIITFLMELQKIIFLLYGIYLISVGKMEIGMVLLAYSYISKLVDNFDGIIATNESFRNASVSRKRFFKLFEYSREETFEKEEFTEEQRGEIRFENILYGNRRKPVLNKISFTIPGNSLIAITGKPGSGKSGILDLLLKLNRQHEGEILIDDMNINLYHNDVYSNLVSSVGQNPVFFNMSIRDNLTIIENDFKKVIDVCKKLEIHDYIISLEEGYDTILVNNATNIHSNVKNLLSISRVLLANSKILLFDETTSLFDLETNEKILNILTSMRDEHTIIIVTKDKPILRKADKVIVIENGKLIANGTHTKLSKNNEEYKKLLGIKE